MTVTAREGSPGSQGRDESQPPPGILSPTYRSLTLGIFAMIFVIAFEGMAVATAMPVAVSDLHGVAAYAWAFSGFSVASMVATVLAGQIADRWGPLPPLLAGGAAFAVGLSVAGTAPSMVVFVAGRMLQGIGAGSVIVAIYVVVARAYDAPLRPKAFSMMSTAWVLPAIIGPVIAGALAEHASWRYVFLGILPLAIVMTLLVASRVRRVQGRPVDSGSVVRPRMVWLALASAVGIGLVQFSGQRIVWSSLAYLLVGLALLLPSLPRILPRGTLRFGRGLPTVVLMRGLFAGGFMGIEAFVPLMLVKHRGLSPTLAGSVLTASAISWAIGSWLQSRPRLRIPRYALIRYGALTIVLGALLVIAALNPHVPPWFAGVGWFFAGLGMGLAFASISVVLFELSPKDSQGENSAALQVSDAVGSVLLVGLGGVIFASLRENVGLTWAFAPIYLVMALVLGVAAFGAGRIRVRASTP